MLRTLLIDADIVAYQIAATNQTDWKWDADEVSHLVNEPEVAFKEADVYLAELVEKLKADEMIICLTDDVNFRKSVLPTYKMNRAGVVKPELLKPLKDYFAAEYKSYKKPGLEADDVMGILSTHPKIIPGQKIIVSIDKDLKQIPGWLYNPRKHSKPVLIEERDATYYHMTQTLTGDAVDGYKGCPKIGPKTAEKILFGCSPPWGTWEESWQAVVATFESKGLTEADALVQARVARMCRWQDYDFKKKEVRLWQPPTGKAASTVGGKRG